MLLMLFVACAEMVSSEGSSRGQPPRNACAPAAVSFHGRLLQAARSVPMPEASHLCRLQQPAPHSRRPFLPLLHLQLRGGGGADVDGENSRKHDRACDFSSVGEADGSVPELPQSPPLVRGSRERVRKGGACACAPECLREPHVPATLPACGLLRLRGGISGRRRKASGDARPLGWMVVGRGCGGGDGGGCVCVCVRGCGDVGG